MPLLHAVIQPHLFCSPRLFRSLGGGATSNTVSRTVLGYRLGLGVVTAVSLALLAPSALQAQQPIRPLVRNGPCPMGYFGSGDYCVPSSNPATRGALEKSGNGCPMGFYSSGNYCLSTPSNQREAIERVGTACPMGWLASGSYCVKNH